MFLKTMLFRVTGLAHIGHVFVWLERWLIQSDAGQGETLIRLLYQVCGFAYWRVKNRLTRIPTRMANPPMANVRMPLLRMLMPKILALTIPKRNSEINERDRDRKC